MEQIDQKVVKVPGKFTISDDVYIGNDLPLTIIAGPCVCESREHAYKMSSQLNKIVQDAGFNFIYKTSFDKANRTSCKSFRGIDFDECMDIFDVIRDNNIKIITDVHTPEQCSKVAKHVDMLQTPAMLMRSTDLIIAASETGLPVNVKQGQFAAPQHLQFVIEKMGDNKNILLCHRGVSFGYCDLVADMTTFIDWKNDFGYPTVLDATHSSQSIGGLGEKSGGNREYGKALALAGSAIGLGAIFMEVHDSPDNAKSDSASQLDLKDIPELLRKIKAIDRVVKNYD